MNTIKILAIDLAKNIFHLHGINEKGKCLLKKKVSRRKLLETIAQLQKTTIAMEACAGANYWARKFIQMGHEVKIIAAQYVKPYVKTNKNDEADAQAIAEAASRAHMHFVAVKSVEQQDIQGIHRVRERLVKQRVCLVNEIRGLLQEYGLIIPQGRSNVSKHLPVFLEEADNELSDRARVLFADLSEELSELDKKIQSYDLQLKQVSRSSEICQRLEKIEGVGPITSTAIISAVGDAKGFKNGRCFSAWLGLVPRQHSSGGKSNLGKISKRGNVYLRTLLIHGARSALIAGRSTEKGRWAKMLLEKKGNNKTSVALANKTARIVWAMMARGTEYNPEYRKAA